MRAGAFSDGYYVVDTLTLPTTATSWVLDTLVVWATWGTLGGPLDVNPALQFEDGYSGLTLALGLSNNAMTVHREVDLAAPHPYVTIEQAAYKSDTAKNYQGSSGSYRQIWRIEFSNLGYAVPSGGTVFFGVNAATTPGTTYFFVHSSNAALSGSMQTGADDTM